MREIKFKAKRLDNEEWCEGYFYEENGNTYIIENRQKESMLNRNITREVDPSTVCQFTGLKDCENQDIYEGDIMAEKEYPEFEVGYINCTFAAAYVGDDKFIFNLTALSEVCTVCGNKFDKEKWRMEKKVLTVHLAEPWYSMISDGRKTEEYREIKPYWIKRLTTNCEVLYDVAAETHCGEVLYRPYTHILFVKGYPKGNKPSVEKEIESISIGKPKKGLCPDKWLDTEFFIIKFK